MKNTIFFCHGCGGEIEWVEDNFFQCIDCDHLYQAHSHEEIESDHSYQDFTFSPLGHDNIL